MAWLVTKYAITAALVVRVSEFARRRDRLGGFVAALPLVTLLWLHVEKQLAAKRPVCHAGCRCCAVAMCMSSKSLR